ncbi:MAG TPA: M28 family peptidase [Vicinamibacterales bacterium]|nr:M28 family peptidase [Vicinamibacterales bacterium]
MTRRLRAALVGGVAVAVFIAVSLPLVASETIDYDGINKIKQQGLNPDNSKVMEIMSYLTDVYGPRLTGSPNVQKAGDWAVATMKSWGLANVSLEPWTACPPDVAAAMASGQRAGGAAAGGGAGGGGGRGNNPPSCNFPRGWANEKFYMEAVAPQQFPIPGTPTGWTPGTNGLVRGDVMLVTETTQEDLQAKYAGGKLKGKWVITSDAPDVAAYWNPPGTRYTKEQLENMSSPEHPAELGVTPPGGGRGGRGAPAAGPGRGGAGGAPPFNRNNWFKSEGVLGVLSTAPRGHGIYTIGGSSATDPTTGLTAIVIPAEQYGRIARLLAKNMPVTIEADIENTYYPNPPMFNVVGEIPGTDKADELVMLGAHFDSWHASTGATDNGAGSGAMLEAMRILKQSGVRLRRTVRIGLWTGEEQGLLGSRDYVSRHFGTPAPGGGRGAGGGAPAGPPPPPTLLPDAARFAGYFNIDNGTGAIRGVYLQGNDAVAPIFRDWMEPFHSIGMTTLTIANTGGTDHLSFDAIGLPGFQFIQDAVEYDTMTHHTNLDSYERLQPEDMRRNATIAAAFAFLAANRDDKLPHKPATSAPAGRGRGGE